MLPYVRLNFLLVAMTGTLSMCPTASAATPTSSDSTITDQIDTPESLPEAVKNHLLNGLPPAISDGLDVNLWGWFSYLHNDQSEYSDLYDVELSLDVTKSFSQRIAVSAEGNFIDANGQIRGELEQGYLSAMLWENGGTILTIGKFNANFGVEARDYWNRETGTTSLLFGAQPQDLIGVMLTQPVGRTKVTLRPFLSEDFQGTYDFNQSPAAGLQVEYKPCHAVELAVTNWVGPGAVLGSGTHLEAPYMQGAYGDTATSIFSNWQGPNLMANRGGTLYFLDAKAIVHASADLTLSFEYLLGTTSTAGGRNGWYGCLALANYDLTDHLHVFTRFSYLYDSDWLITGNFQHMCEASCGVGYEIYKDVELRGEYRHDFSNVTGDMNSFSLHLSFGI